MSTKRERIAAALKDPLVLKAMRADPQTADFFDEDGNFNRDISGFYDDGNTRAHKV